MLTIMTSTIRANKAQAAAGIENHSMGSLAITSSTISENNGYLSGIMNLGKIYLTNVTISGNESEWGDAFLTGGDHSSVFASYVTIADNAGTGFYQVNGGSVYLVNTIIANNDDGNCDTEIQLFLGQNNLSSDDTCAFFGNGSQTGVDPLLGPLADNGVPPGRRRCCTDPRRSTAARTGTFLTYYPNLLISAACRARSMGTAMGSMGTTSARSSSLRRGR